MKQFETLFGISYNAFEYSVHDTSYPKCAPVFCTWKVGEYCVAYPCTNLYANVVVWRTPIDSVFLNLLVELTKIQQNSQWNLCWKAKRICFIEKWQYFIRAIIHQKTNECLISGPDISVRSHNTADKKVNVVSSLSFFMNWSMCLKCELSWFHTDSPII